MNNLKYILDEVMDTIKQNKLSIFNNINFFDNWTKIDKEIIYNNADIIEIKLGDFIYKEDEESKYMYFILEGEVELASK